MLIKGRLTTAEADIIIKSKELRYPDNAGGIQKGYELCQIIAESRVNDTEIHEFIQADKEDKANQKIAERKETSYRITEKVNDKLVALSEDASCSKIEVLRAILAQREQQMNDESIDIFKCFLEDVSEIKGTYLEKALYYWSQRNIKADLSEYNAYCQAAFKQKKGEFFDFAYSGFRPLLIDFAMKCASDQIPLFKMENNEITMNTARSGAPAQYITNISKKYLASDFIEYTYGDAKNLGNSTNAKKNLWQNSIHSCLIDDFFAAAYSISNVIPVPDNDFNGMKIRLTGNDSFALMLMIMNKAMIDSSFLDSLNESLKKTNIILSLEKVESWNRFFVKNQKRYALQPYYAVEADKIIPVPDFWNQSPEKPFPTYPSEVADYYYSVISKARKREELLRQSR